VHDQPSCVAADQAGGADQPTPRDPLRAGACALLKRTQTGGLEGTLGAEACALVERTEAGDRQQRWQAALLIGELLDRARRALAGRSPGSVITPATFARVLRAGVLVRDLAEVPDLPPDPLVDELITHTIEHGLVPHNAAAQALRGTLAETRGDLDTAMDAAVNAMVTVEDFDEPCLERVFAHNDIAALLLRLGTVSLAVRSYAKAAANAETAGLIREHLITLGNLVASELVLGFTLERTPKPERAAEHFQTAIRLAGQGLRTWRLADLAPNLRADHAAGFHAALAMESCDGELEARLREHLASADPQCRLVPGIVLARRLAATGRTEQARTTLTGLVGWPRVRQAPPQLRMALFRHMAELEATPGSPSPYVNAMDAELWALWVARSHDLGARLDRERLRRKHGPITALAEDPLTGLPNRRALDQLLTELAAVDQPGAVGMVDLDGLRKINECDSHADGDATLRAVAVAAQGTLPATDSVIRYGGDEFVLLLPFDDLPTAAAKVERVVTAVAALPADRGFGITVSAGVVGVRPGENADSILVRADDAMCQAKEAGGNQVHVG
jgi:diguanylate cyclase (GGDEF)-like protein